MNPFISLVKALLVRGFFGCLLISAFACQGDNTDGSSCSRVLCTEEFRTINVMIRTPENDPVALDAFRVELMETSEDLTLPYSGQELNNYQQWGEYPLINDSFVSEFERRVIDLLFLGYISGELVIEETYTVGFDCCHVLLADGTLDLVYDDN